MAGVRRAFGFEGLLMSDDLNMHALSGPVEMRALRVIGAGIDLVLHCNGQMDEMQAVAEVTPFFESEGLTRHQAFEALRSELTARPVDIQDDLARIAALKTREAHCA